MTSAIPSGGALQNIPSGQTPGGGTVANPTWLPPFKLGQGLTGVFTDARGLIAGEVATATGQAASGGGATSTGSGDTTGAGAGPSAGAAGTTPSGGASVPGQTGGSGPAPKATSQAQRLKNLNDAYAQYGTGPNPDPSVP